MQNKVVNVEIMDLLKGFSVNKNSPRRMKDSLKRNTLRNKKQDHRLESRE